MNSNPEPTPLPRYIDVVQEGERSPEIIGTGEHMADALASLRTQLSIGVRSAVPNHAVYLNTGRAAETDELMTMVLTDPFVSAVYKLGYADGRREGDSRG